MNNRNTDMLDRHYAEELGAHPRNFDSGAICVVSHDTTLIHFAKGRPLLLFSIERPNGTIVSVLPHLTDRAREAVSGMVGHILYGDIWESIITSVSPLAGDCSWFMGVRLYCDPEHFIDCTLGEVLDVSNYPGRPCELAGQWKGPVFGQMVDGIPVSLAAVKPLSDVVWDIRVETLAEYGGRGFAKSVVSVALKYIFENGRLAGWGAERSNIGSLGVANANGFRHYGYDYGCIGIVPQFLCSGV